MRDMERWRGRGGLSAVGRKMRVSAPGIAAFGVAALLSLTSGERLWAQEKPSGPASGATASAAAQPGAESDKPAASGSAEKGKKRTEPKGRLPTYFGEVVDAQQRERIYEIQARYNAEIKKMQEQMHELETTRDKEVQSVLTAEQHAKVAQLQETAKTKRSEASKRKKLVATDAQAANESDR